MTPDASPVMSCPAASSGQAQATAHSPRLEALRNIGKQRRKHQGLNADGGNAQHQQPDGLSGRAGQSVHSGASAGCASNVPTGICSKSMTAPFIIWAEGETR